MSAELLREVRTLDGDSQYVEVWHTTPPEPGQKYRVLKDQWVSAKAEGQLAERHIHEIDREPHISPN